MTDANKKIETFPHFRKFCDMWKKPWIYCAQYVMVIMSVDIYCFVHKILLNIYAIDILISDVSYFNGFYIN